MHQHTNRLAKSTSPYLLQHAHNPVDWQEWGDEALQHAKKQDMPILVSIGYSSCHWCHVMEKESFEDPRVAKLMNDHFVNIKVDREERPDIDQIYMDAVQAMGLQGGWPLNVFLTPDQKPFYGGTYFPKNGWINLLASVAEAFEKNRAKIDESAEAFTKSLQLNDAEKYKLKATDHVLNADEITNTYRKLAAKFDPVDGGVKKSPKFPMPSVWQYLATYYHTTKDERALNHLSFTLQKIANGGIYDHIGGGFARYSTDAEWHVPHFEKMLYDNGQLLSLYANGYKLTKNERFRQTMMETINWLEREMLDASGGFYAALDADSEGEEGKFYVLSYDEANQLAGDNFEWISEYFDIKKEGNWESTNALRIVKSKEDIQKKFNVSISSIEEGISAFKKAALAARATRVRPGLDYKIIAGWNGLTLTGLCEVYQATAEERALALAKRNATFIKEKLIRKGLLQRFPDKEMEGFMEDYASVIQSFITYYETTFDRDYLTLARTLTERANDAFFDPEEKRYYFTSEASQNLIARKKELFDNVIPSSNSLMAWNLVHLGTHLYDDELVTKGTSMLAQVKELLLQEPEYMSNWGVLAMELANPFAEVVMVGPEIDSFAKTINSHFLPNKIIAGSKNPSTHPPFQLKELIDNQTTIYVCYDKACKLPVTNTQSALDQMHIVK